MAKRPYLAAVLAPAVGVAIACLGFVASAAVVLRGDSAAVGWWAIFEHWLGFYAILGLPAAYIVEALALAIFRGTARRKEPRLWLAVTAATSLGGVLVFAVWAAVGGTLFGLITLPSGLIGGAVAGAMYWGTGVKPARNAPAA